MKPISPSEVISNKRVIPDKIIVAFNTFILDKWNGNRAIIYLPEITNYIVDTFPEFNKEEIFKNKWMDVEDIFREVGWSVVFHKMPYYDTSPDYYVFMRKV